MDSKLAKFGTDYFVDGIKDNPQTASRKAKEMLGLTNSEELWRLGWGGPLHQLIHSPFVRDIMVSHDARSPTRKMVWVRNTRGEKSVEPINITDDWIEMIAYGWKYAGSRRVPDADPHAMFRHTAFFPESDGGVRFQYAGRATSPYGASIYIRRLPTKPITLKELIANGTITNQAAYVLTRLLLSGSSVVVSGQTGSGKTTFLGGLIHYLQSVIEPLNLLIVEKSYEIPTENPAYRWEETDSNSLPTLAAASTQMGLERLCLGESTGPEAYFVAKALTQGVPVMTTLHASSPSDGVMQLARLSLEYNPTVMDNLLRMFAEQGLIGLHIDLKEREGGLLGQVVGIEEVISSSGGRVVMNPIFRWDEEKKETVFNQGAFSQISPATRLRFKAARMNFPTLAEIEAEDKRAQDAKKEATGQNKKGWFR
jgi:type IV secretory pathway ATPase VirB11/archaellum biosynthesis ATPase